MAEFALIGAVGMVIYFAYVVSLERFEWRYLNAAKH